MLGLSGKPVVLERHRADVSQLRMQPSAVVPEQPGDRFILGVASGIKALPMQALHLQGAQQRLATGIVPAVATSAHRTRDAVLLEHVPEGVAGVPPWSEW